MIMDTAASDVSKRTGATCSYTVDGFASSAAASKGTPVTDILVEKDTTSSAQCRSLMAAAIGAPLLALAV